MLKVRRVGVQDNFFELGGHSLLATPGIASRVQKTLQRDVPLGDVRVQHGGGVGGVSTGWRRMRSAPEKVDRLSDLMAELEGFCSDRNAPLVRWRGC